MKSFDKDPKILFEDNHLLVVIKPAGWLCQKDSHSHLPDLESWAEAYRIHQEKKSGQAFVRACHRLDAPVEGIVCLAKTSKAQQRLQQAQLAGEWKKFYLAITCPAPLGDYATLCDWLEQRDGRAYRVSESHPNGKQARLSFSCLHRQNTQACLGIELITGRYHQIRAQLSHRGIPIVGDQKYGGRKADTSDGIRLNHVLLILDHPISKQALAFANLPSWAPQAAYPWLEHQIRKAGASVVQELH
jgi:23S rRNA pseudouridine1911/1915/1917 synthase